MIQQMARHSHVRRISALKKYLKGLQTLMLIYEIVRSPILTEASIVKLEQSIATFFSFYVSFVEKESRKLHLLLHIPQFIRNCGPIGIFPFRQMISTLI